MALFFVFLLVNTRISVCLWYFDLGFYSIRHPVLRYGFGFKFMYKESVHMNVPQRLYWITTITFKLKELTTELFFLFNLRMRNKQQTASSPCWILTGQILRWKQNMWGAEAKKRKRWNKSAFGESIKKCQNVCQLLITANWNAFSPAQCTF